MHQRAPGWIPGSINLAIALLNDTGVKVEAAKKAGADAASDNFDEALDLLAGVLERDPDNPYAHFCRGIILEQQGQLAEATPSFQAGDRDRPRRRGGLVLAGIVRLPIPDDPGKPDMRRAGKEADALCSRRRSRCDPYLTPAHLQARVGLRFAGQPEKQQDLLARWKEINPDRAGPVARPRQHCREEVR